MDISKRNALIEKGVNYEEALHRFLGMEDMYEKFLRQYAADESINDITSGLNNMDVDAVFKAAHGMKGLAGNLGITNVYKLAGEVTEMTRGKLSMNEVDVEVLTARIKELKQADIEMSELIKAE